MANLAAPYSPRKPTETVLYGVVRRHLESFLKWTREAYAKPLPAYVESEFREYLTCGVFERGFLRARCDACGYDLLVAFSCKRRGICPSCAGRRMANTGAHLVDRVLPAVPLRQYVLSLPYELRMLAAFKPDVLAAIGRLFVEAVFAVYRARAKKEGIAAPERGALTFVQRFGGSLNLNVHLHVVVMDGVFRRDDRKRVHFHPAAPPTPSELDAVVRRSHKRVMRWLGGHGYLRNGSREDEATDEASPALESCAQIALQRGVFARVDVDGTVEADEPIRPTSSSRFVSEHESFNVHAGVRIEGDDDVGRERLCRYGARPAMALGRLRLLPGDTIAYRVKYAEGRRAKHRIMTSNEFLARLAALIPPPRYPLLRFHGVIAPRSSWRKEVIPKPRGAVSPCAPAVATPPKPPVTSRGGGSRRVGASPLGVRGDTGAPRGAPAPVSRPRFSDEAGRGASFQRGAPPASSREIIRPVPPSETNRAVFREPATLLAPNVIGVRHWERLLGGRLLAASPRIDWARLLRRTFDIDVLQCAKCHGRIRVLAEITQRDVARRILVAVGMDTETPPVARARDPDEGWDGVDAAEPEGETGTA